MNPKIVGMSLVVCAPGAMNTGTTTNLSTSFSLVSLLIEEGMLGSTSSMNPKSHG